MEESNPCCDDPPHISFNWKYAQENKGHKLYSLSKQLKKAKDLKFGQLYVCMLCGRNWVLDVDQLTMSSVPFDKLDVLNAWNESRLSISPEHLRMLDEIGGTAPNYWAGRSGVIEVPCSITTESGEIIDPALVWITKRPPIDFFTEHLRLFQNIKTVRPSEFALPMDVRNATFFAGEVVMGFAPTRVVAANGTPFVLHWATSLFDHGGIAGSEIRLSLKSFNMDEQVTVAEADSKIATYFIADWFEGVEKLNKAKPKGLVRQKIGILLRKLF